MLTKTKLILLTGATLALVVSGCGKYKKSADSNNTDPVPTATATPYPDGQIPTTPPSNANEVDENTNPWTSGATAVFTPVSDSVFNEWVASHPVQPKNVKINVDLKKSANNYYSGYIKIRYTSNGQTYEGTLYAANTLCNDSVFKSTPCYKQEFDMYNYWFKFQGKQVFSGFFDDPIGSIVLIINQAVDLGDGAGPSELGGEVWFKNFQANWAGYYAGGGTGSVVMPCWFRSIGPYDCRSSIVINKTSLYPTDTYVKLGTFTNLNKLKAFQN